MTEEHRSDPLMQTVADSLSEPGDIEQTMSRLTQTARDTVPGADCASICVRHHKRGLETISPTNPLIYQADALQNELQEGPSYAAVADEDVVYSRDLSTDTRWPRYGSGLSDLGLLCQLSIGIAHPVQANVSLNLYSRARDAFGNYASLGDLFSSQAKVALRYAHALQTLSGAVTAGTTIGRATGVVMERQGLTAEGAMQFVVDMAKAGNTQLLAAAEAILVPTPAKGRKRA